MTSRKLIVLGLVVVLALSLLAAGCKGRETAKTPVALPPPSTGAPKPTVAVDKDAVPIVIEAYYPFNESHKFIVDYLKSIEVANPGNIKVTGYDTQTEEGRKKWMTTGLTCSGVFVNGRTSFELTTNGKKENVAFLQRMDVMWIHQDLERVLTDILRKAGKTFVSPNYKPKPAAVEGAAGAGAVSGEKPEAQPKAKPSGSKG